ncbi:unnamed protein product [Effrenium voratum]|uniref:Protein kinase domain-containing protein n=1 Tax=Effrenium voratum TaxID=2562239 RepID=A0AA36I3R4_9DINO|nr:unnamed protein product [Effrenium voratum]
MAVHYVGHYQPQGQLYLRHVQHAAPGPTLTIQGRHRRMSAPPPPPPEACRRAPVRADGYQVLKRMPLQMRRVQEEERPQADFGRVPQPLPSQWRADFELSPMGYDLGGGAFAEVFRVQHQRSDKSFAVKVMHRPNFAMRGIERQIEAEIEAMRLAAGLARDLKEEIHILRLLDVCEEGEYVYLLLELCEQGDLLRKLNWEPTQRIAEQEDSISVPTPLKPRSYDPNRNMAYTPPVSPEPTPERTRWPQAEFHMPEKENSTDPEVSPERKTRLADKVSAKWSSPKDDLSEKLQAARVQIAKLASPQRQLTRPARKTIASGMPTWEVERGFGSPARENRPWKQPDEWSSEKPVNKVLEPMPEEEGPIYSSVKMPAYPREPMMRPLATDSDLLMTSAPHAYRDNRAMGRFPLDSRLQLRSPGAPPAQGQLLTPRAAERHPPLQAKMVPALPGNAGVNAPLGPGPTVVQSAACLRFQQGSPLRSRPQQMATAASSPVMTQVRRVAPAPAPGAFYAAPQLQQVPQLAQHARHAVPVMFAGRQSPLRMAAGAPVGTCLRLQTGPGPDAKA